MRLAWVVAAIALPSLLGWAWMRGMNNEVQTSQDASRALDAFMVAESQLHRDVLRARSGMLRSYDPLVQEVRELRAATARLRSLEKDDGEIVAEVSRLALFADREEQWTEQFKSRNALLQNSLAYFGLFSAHLVDHPNALVQRVAALGSGMLHLTLDASPAVQADVDRQLADISAQGLSADDAALTRGLLAHGRMLRELLPATDGVLKSLFAIPVSAEQLVIHEMILKRERAAHTQAQYVRYALLGLSLVLAALLVQLVLRLRSRALALRQRAEIEHLIAGISTRFINSRPYEIGALSESALAELALYFRADRAYFLITGKVERTYRWCRKGLEFPPGWPERALSLVRYGNTRLQEVIEIDDTARMPAGGDQEILRGAAVHSWLCIPSRGGKSFAGMLALETVDGQDMARSSESGLLRMALEAVTNALERECLERDRERLESNRQHARRMETIGALASGIAHNFNNIVGAILGFTETAQAQQPIPSRTADHLSEIRRAGERARDLVGQILTFGRRRAVHRMRIPVHDLIAEAKSLLDATLPEHTRIVVREMSRDLQVSGDPAQLQQVILNLCNNAAQAMDAAGVIEIETELRTIEPNSRAAGDELPLGQYAVISITDPGRGMDEATLERIFEPFFTTRPEGNGLGLAMVREIVQDHGGAVKVRSAPRAGTRFYIWLRAIPLAHDVTHSETHGIVGGGETVLVLEADPARLLKHEEILAALCYEPVGFTQADEAEAACLAEPGRFDAVLLCTHLQGSAATLEYAASLRAKAPHLPIILATPAAGDFAAPSLADAGISEIIRQPVVSGELAGALLRCLSDPNVPGRSRAADSEMLLLRS